MVHSSPRSCIQLFVMSSLFDANTILSGIGGTNILSALSTEQFSKISYGTAFCKIAVS